jgi:hypothetical protein
MSLAIRKESFDARLLRLGGLFMLAFLVSAFALTGPSRREEKLCGAPLPADCGEAAERRC